VAKIGREARKILGKSSKIKAVKEFSKVLHDGQGFVLLNNRGLSVEDATNLRAKCRENNVRLKVMKNRLFKRALTQAQIDPEQFGDLLKDQTIIAVGMEDPVTPAKVVSEFLKDHEGKMEVKGGFIEGRVVDAAAVDALSKLPGRDELLAKMLGSMQAPVQNVVYALHQSVSKVVYAVDAYRRKQEENAA